MQCIFKGNLVENVRVVWHEIYLYALTIFFFFFRNSYYLYLLDSSYRPLFFPFFFFRCILQTTGRSVFLDAYCSDGLFYRFFQTEIQYNKYFYPTTITSPIVLHNIFSYNRRVNDNNAAGATLVFRNVFSLSACTHSASVTPFRV